MRTVGELVVEETKQQAQQVAMVDLEAVWAQHLTITEFTLAVKVYIQDLRITQGQDKDMMVAMILLPRALLAIQGMAEVAVVELVAQVVMVSIMVVQVAQV